MLQFRDIFATSDGTGAYNLNTLLKIDNIQSNHRCPFCRLVAKTLAAADVGHKLLLNAHDPDEKIRRSVIVTSEYFGSFLKDDLGGRRLQYPRLLLEYTLGIQALAAAQPTTFGIGFDELLRGRRIGKHIDISLLKHWIKACDSHQKGSCRISSKHTTASWQNLGLRMIDVENRCVVTRFTSDKYAALSYVWGGRAVPQLRLQRSTQSRLLTKGGLADHRQVIPFTIKDAMSLCQSMGVRYLWVDALCIDQEDAVDQAHQVEHMHVVYQMADFTIVDADGSDSWAGLRGISSRDTRQHIEAVGKFCLVNVLPAYIDTVRHSVWSQRAWTMQEMYFSRRVICFTKHQAFFQCHNTLWREDIIMESSLKADVQCIDGRRGHSHEQDLAFYKKPIERWGAMKNDPWLLYCGMIYDYTNRSLTNPGDILNAFAGIIAKLSADMNCEFFWGLPVANFDEALLFHHGASEQPTRRQGFPSWSWTGWKAPKEPHQVRGLYCEYLDPFSRQALCSVGDWYRVRQRTYIRIKKSTLSHYHAIRRPPILPQLEELPSGLDVSELDQVLVVQTSTCFMMLDKRFHVPGVLSANSSKRELTRVYAEVGATRKEMEFMVVMAYEKRLGGRERGLRVIAIETDKHGISRRIGLAWSPVETEEWIAYKPTWRTVFLLRNLR